MYYLYLSVVNRSSSLSWSRRWTSHWRNPMLLSRRRRVWRRNSNRTAM